MTDADRQERADYLRDMMASPGGRILIAHIDEEIKTGWDEFIKMPVAQKTNKAAYNYQARYDVLKNLKEWIDSEIRLGE